MLQKVSIFVVLLIQRCRPVIGAISVRGLRADVTALRDD
jgi:hypothetical protein